jgi:hypothetical protein
MSTYSIRASSCANSLRGDDAAIRDVTTPFIEEPVLFRDVSNVLLREFANQDFFHDVEPIERFRFHNVEFEDL